MEMNLIIILVPVYLARMENVQHNRWIVDFTIQVISSDVSGTKHRNLISLDILCGAM